MKLICQSLIELVDTLCGRRVGEMDASWDGRRRNLREAIMVTPIVVIDAQVLLLPPNTSIDVDDSSSNEHSSRIL